MNYARRSDANAVDIKRAIEKCGWSFADTSRVGGGFPDCVIGAGFYSIPAEIKTAAGDLNANQVAFHTAWMGSRILILRDPVQAIHEIRDEMKRQWRRRA